MPLFGRRSRTQSTPHSPALLRSRAVALAEWRVDEPTVFGILGGAQPALALIVRLGP